MVGTERMQLIRDLRMQLLIKNDLPDCYLVPALVNSWNWLTAPYILRTDKEHRVCNKLARRYMAILRTMPGWKELESGSLFYTA